MATTDNVAGATPHLIQHLWDAYAAHLADAVAKIPHQPGLMAVTPAEALHRARASHFRDFAAAYLTEHRVVLNFPVDFNHGLRLSNNVDVTVSPDDASTRGQLQDAGAIGVTQGRSQKGMEGVTSPGNVLPIT